MKQITKIALLLLFFAVSLAGHSQTKNFIDQPYLETTARVDTLVVPDRIHMSVLITEADTKGRTSVEKLENRMATELKALGIDTDKQLSLSDLGSNFKKYFLRKTDIQKSKEYLLVVYDGLTAGRAIQALESIGIANVNLVKTEYSKIEELKIALRKQAVGKAKTQAEAMLEPLNQNLGRALFISDLNTNIVRFQQRAAYGLEYAKAADSSQPLAVEFEKIKVESTVNVKFAME
ncbi:SIMPL domain-containing protein [Flavobacteriaceae bacterium 3-367]